MVSPISLYGPSGQLLSSNGKALGRPTKAQSIVLRTGLSIWKGTVAEEYLAQFKPWTKAVKVLREMEDDIVIGALYESVTAPLMDAKFRITPASPSSIDIKAADFLRQNTIESLEFDWHSHVEDMLTALSYGFAIAEKTMDRDRKGIHWLTDLMPVSQDSLYKWGDLDKHGQPDKFYQSVTTEGFKNTIIEAPMSKLIHFPFRPRKRNPMGRSLSRALYRSWYFKKNLEVVEAIGAERDVGNVPIAELGEGFITDTDETKLRTALEGLRIDETAYLIVPNGVKVQPFGTGGRSINTREIIRDYQHLIRQRFFMDFISFGTERVGTQALAKEVTGFFSLALGSIQRQLLSVWRRQLVPYLFRYNMLHFDGMTAYPRLEWMKPGKINIQSLAQSVVQLLQSGSIHWSKELEDHLREAFEIPPITDDEIQTSIQMEAAKAKLLSVASTQGPDQTSKGDPKTGQSAGIT